MTRAEKLLENMRRNPDDVRFSDALKVATKHFGAPRISGSHHIFATRTGQLVNLQSKGGKAKGYQIRQLLEAIEE